MNKTTQTMGKALFLLCKKDVKTLLQTELDYQDYLNIMSLPIAKTFFYSKTIYLSEKKKIMEILSKRWHPLFVAYMEISTNMGIFEPHKAIFKYFQTLKNSLFNTMNITLKHACEKNIELNIIQSIKKHFETFLKKKLIVSTHFCPEILGGFIVETDKFVRFDMSLKRQLINFAKQFPKSSGVFS